jgi:methionyl aminopeptidase
MINIDVTVICNGYHGDTSRTFLVGKPKTQAVNLSSATLATMHVGIWAVRPGQHLGTIGSVMDGVARSFGYSVVKEFGGHGIGKVFHEEPFIANYGAPGTGEVIREGMIFTVEPMVNAGRSEIKLLPDGWTVVTKDHSLSAQWEHTVLVTKTGYEILTLSTRQKDEQTSIKDTSHEEKLLRSIRDDL